MPTMDGVVDRGCRAVGSRCRDDIINSCVVGLAIKLKLRAHNAIRHAPDDSAQVGVGVQSLREQEVGLQFFCH